MGERLDELVRRQHGAVTREQALAAGVTRHGIAHRVRRGWWRRVLPATYVVAGLDEGDATRRWAALLWAPPGSCLSHDTAAVVHGLPLLTADARMHVTTVGRGLNNRADLVVHRLQAPLAAEDVTTRDGLRLTGRARTAVDVARALPAQQRAGFLIACVHQRGVRPWNLLAAAERAGARCAAVHRLLATLDPAAQSDAERTTRTILLGAALPVEAQVAIRVSAAVVFHADLALRESMIVIEVDGQPYHSDLAAVVRDRQRDEALRAAGWEVVRVMPHELSRPADLISRVWRLHAARLPIVRRPPA
jgi:very-short-patch-repair endonuclease